MKAFSLTALTITAYLILTHLLSPTAASSRKPFSITSGAEALTAPQSAPATGFENSSAQAEKQVAAGAADNSQGFAQTAIDAPTPVEAPAEASLQIKSVPASTGLLAEPVALAEAPVAPSAETIVVAEPPAAVAPVEVQSPELDAFKARVVNGQAGEVVGVFVQGALALPVVQQPESQPNFVSTEDNRVTQFASTKAYGTIGLLAHNYLSGRLFFNLTENQEVIAVYGDGQQQAYRITRAQRFQALDPTNPYSNFIDVNDPAQKVISATDLFSSIYTKPDRLVLQTCIAANGNSSWGRLFVTAEKVATE